MGRRRISTKYRELYAGKKLDDALEKCKNNFELWSLYLHYYETATIERKSRLVNNDTIIKDMNKIIKRAKKLLLEASTASEMVGLNNTILVIEIEKTKKQNKYKGGQKTAKKKELRKQGKIWTDWFEINYSPFSVNYMYEYRYGKKVRTQSYDRWWNNFPRREIPRQFTLLNKYNMKIQKSLALDIEVITIEGVDVDNCIKSFQDILIAFWGLRDDNKIQQVSIKRVGTVDNYRDCKIRFRLKNI